MTPLPASSQSAQDASFSAHTPANTEARLRFENVFKEYATEGGVVRALDGISLNLLAGTFTALMGPSGCGKSTLLNMAGAMDFPTRGQVLVDGVSTAGLDDAGLTRLRREKIGFVFQSFQLLPTLSVAENVELPLLLAGRTDARRPALEQLAAVGLAGSGARLPHQLSGGQMQRVAIARALVTEPRLLLADEPTGNLDSVTGESILELLRTLSVERNATILMATHSAEAAAMAGAVVHLRDGRVEDVKQSR